MIESVQKYIGEYLKKYKKSILWVAGVLLLFTSITIAFAYSKRDQMLKKMVDKALLKAKNNYHLNVEVKNIYFSGIRTLNIDRVNIVPENRDTLLQIDQLSVSVRIFPLIFGDVKLQNISLGNGKLYASFKKDQSNLDFLLKKDTQEKRDTSQKRDLAGTSYRIMKQILNKIPSEMTIKNFLFELNDKDSTGFKIGIQDMSVNSGEVEGKMLIDSSQNPINMEGEFNADDDFLALNLLANKGDSIKLGYLEQKLHLKFNCKEIDMALTNFKSKNDETQIYTQFKTKDFKLYHPKIASKYIQMPEAIFNANLFIGKNYIQLDSSSKISINQAYLHPFAKYTPGKHKVYEIGVNIPRQNAQKIIKAFPNGTFESFEGMEVEGDLAYKMLLHLNTKKPDNVTFSSAITPFNFKIKKYGRINFGAINKPFKHAIYEDDKFVREIEVGPNNPNYTPYPAISQSLIQCILTSEDPSFFSNNGFVLESIRKSIATNYKEKKFVRGGSTISMQLVKNAFLNREKTLVRKIEEIAIVWLIHNQKIISKQRMLEVYFNIIELGRGVYGIGESTQYYFGLKPSELSTGHGLFYSNIIPSPKKTMRKFMSNGHLKPYLFPYFRFIGNIMAKKGLIPYDGNGYGFYNVMVKEGLRKGLDAPSVSTQIDSLDTENMGDLFEQFKMQNPNLIQNPQEKHKFLKEDSIKNIQSKMMDSMDVAQPSLSKKELRKLKRTQKQNEN